MNQVKVKPEWFRYDGVNAEVRRVIRAQMKQAIVSDDPPGIWQIVRGIRTELSNLIEDDRWESGQMG